MAIRKIEAQPAQQIEVCDCCGRDGYLQTCKACGGKYCIIHNAIITGCIIEVPVCRKCQGRPDVLAIVEKYAPLINAPRKERDAEISALNDPVVARRDGAPPAE